MHRKLLNLTAVGFIFFLLAALYAAQFIETISGSWFNPLVTNDDAQQQIFPLHKVLDPELFKDDIITRVMEGYLPPLHWWLSAAFTRLTLDPVLAGHWVMFLQFAACVLCLFLAVRKLASVPAALFAVCWFLLAQVLWARMMGGLPRGWAGCIITGFFYFAAVKNHTAIIILLFLGLLLNPPAAFLVGVCYGIWVSIGLIGSDTRNEATKRLLILALCTPLLAATAWQVVKRPTYIGQMVTLEEASKMPAFERPGGRFAFLPFRSPLTEINSIGARAFVQNGNFVPEVVKRNLILIPLLLILGTFLLERRQGRELAPRFLLVFLLGTVLVYSASRVFAFRLYVPDRHLLFPLNLTWITLFPIALWRGFYAESAEGYGDTSFHRSKFSALALLVFGLLLSSVNGIGAQTVPGLHLRTDLRLRSYRWLEQNSSKSEIIAGHPARIDAVQLVAKRSAYVTIETAHPFYPNYYSEMERRTEIALKSYYTTDTWERFYDKVRHENIRYFVFVKSDFTPEALEHVRYAKPFAKLIRRLTRRSPHHYLGWKLANKSDPRPTFVAYEDDEVAVIDIDKLKETFSPALPS